MKQLAYKRFAKRVVITALLTMSTSIMAKDDTCSYVELNSKNSRLQINRIDNHLLFTGLKSFYNWGAAKTYKVPVGIHAFQGHIVKNGEIKANTHFALNITDKMHYFVSINENTINIEEKKLNSCDLKADLDVDDFVPSVTKTITLSTKKSRAIQNIFNESLFLKNENNRSARGMIPAGYSANIGIVFGRTENNTKGIKVLSVTPFSPASNFGLLSGDLLLAIDDKDLFNYPVAKMHEIIYQNMFLKNEHLSVKVKRNDSVLELTGRLKKNFIPKYQFNINKAQEVAIMQDVKITSSKQNQLDLMMSELSTELKATYPNIDQVIIDIPSSKNFELGIQGILKSLLNGKQGLLLETIAKESTAAQLDLRVGDILININGKEISDVEEVFSNFRELDSKTLNIMYLRNGKESTVSIDINSYQRPSVFLMISLNDEEDYLKQIKNEETIALRLKRLPSGANYLNNPYKVYDSMTNGRYSHEWGEDKRMAKADARRRN